MKKNASTSALHELDVYIREHSQNEEDLLPADLTSVTQRKLRYSGSDQWHKYRQHSKLSEKTTRRENEITAKRKPWLTTKQQIRSSADNHFQHFITNLRREQLVRLQKLRQVAKLFALDMELEDAMDIELPSVEESSGRLSEEEFEAFLLGRRELGTAGEDDQSLGDSADISRMEDDASALLNCARIDRTKKMQRLKQTLDILAPMTADTSLNSSISRSRVESLYSHRTSAAHCFGADQRDHSGETINVMEHTKVETSNSPLFFIRGGCVKSPSRSSVDPYSTAERVGVPFPSVADSNPTPRSNLHKLIEGVDQSVKETKSLLMKAESEARDKSPIKREVNEIGIYPARYINNLQRRSIDAENRETVEIATGRDEDMNRNRKEDNSSVRLSIVSADDTICFDDGNSGITSSPAFRKMKDLTSRMNEFKSRHHNRFTQAPIAAKFRMDAQSRTESFDGIASIGIESSDGNDTDDVDDAIDLFSLAASTALLPAASVTSPQAMQRQREFQTSTPEPITPTIAPIFT